MIASFFDTPTPEFLTQTARSLIPYFICLFSLSVIDGLLLTFDRKPYFKPKTANFHYLPYSIALYLFVVAPAVIYGYLHLLWAAPLLGCVASRQNSVRMIAMDSFMALLASLAAFGFINAIKSFL